MKSALILQHVWENPIGYVGELMDRHCIAYDTVNVETHMLPNPSSYDAIIAFGGSQHVYESNKYPYFSTEKKLIAQAVKQEIPYLGICLGGQLLANVLGGEVRQHTTAELGFYEVTFTTEGIQDPLYYNLPGYQKVFHWHEDTFDLPNGAILLATSETTPNQAFRYGDFAYGVQYHIEVTYEMLYTWLYHPDLRDNITETLGDVLVGEGRLQFSHYHEHSHIMFENFLKISQLI